MKKLVLRIAIGVVVLIIAVVLVITLFLDSAVKRGIETVGPTLVKVDVKLDSVSLSLLSGSGKIKGLVVGNPEGYKTPAAIQVGKASLALKPGSLLGEKLVINSINVTAPEITFEGGLTGNNLSKILSNLEASTTSGGGTGASDKSASRKLQVDDFLIRDGKVHVSLTGLAGKSATVALPEIHLTALGTGPDGITTAALSQQVLREVLEGAIKAAGPALADLGKNAAGEVTKNLGEGANNALEKAKGLGDKLKKK